MKQLETYSGGQLKRQRKLSKITNLRHWLPVPACQARTCLDRMTRVRVVSQETVTQHGGPGLLNAAVQRQRQTASTNLVDVPRRTLASSQRHTGTSGLQPTTIVVH